MNLSDSDCNFIREDPKEAKWIKDHIEPQFWLKFESLADSQSGQGSSSPPSSPAATYMGGTNQI